MATGVAYLERYEWSFIGASDDGAASSGRRSLHRPSGDGRIEMGRTSRSIVARARPDAARVEGEPILTARLATGSTVVSEGRSWITTTGQTFAGRVTVDGVTVFDERWER